MGFFVSCISDIQLKMACLRNGLIVSCMISNTSSLLGQRRVQRSFLGLFLAWQRSLHFGRNTHTECGRVMEGAWEHHFRALRLRCLRLRLRHPLGMLRKQLLALPDPPPQVVPIGAGSAELQRMAQWYKRGSAQSSIESSVTYSRSNEPQRTAQ